MKLSVNTIGKRALSQKKQSRVESFQHCSDELASKATGERNEWTWLRVPTAGADRTMTARNVDAQCGDAIRHTEGYMSGFK